MTQTEITRTTGDEGQSIVATGTITDITNDVPGGVRVVLGTPEKADIVFYGARYQLDGASRGDRVRVYADRSDILSSQLGEEYNEIQRVERA